jgi:redox-sensitive bicupin YhaK (pirin superfamily)
MRSALARNFFRVPSALKMTDPRYQDIPSSAIPEVTDDGTRVHIICGEFWGKRGPVEGVAADPNYLDISVTPGQRKRLEIKTTRNAFAYVFAGSGTLRDASGPRAVLTEQVAKPDASPINDVENHSLVLFDRGDEIIVQAGDEGIRFLQVSGKPIEEPVCMARPDCDEHAGTATSGNGRTAYRRLHQTSVNRRQRREPLRRLAAQG